MTADDVIKVEPITGSLDEQIAELEAEQGRLATKLAALRDKRAAVEVEGLRQRFGVQVLCPRCAAEGCSVCDGRGYIWEVSYHLTSKGRKLTGAEIEAIRGRDADDSL